MFFFKLHSFISANAKAPKDFLCNTRAEIVAKLASEFPYLPLDIKEQRSEDIGKALIEKEPNEGVRASYFHSLAVRALSNKDIRRMGDHLLGFEQSLQKALTDPMKQLKKEGQEQIEALEDLTNDLQEMISNYLTLSQSAKALKMKY